jgi:hypothetical protein
MWKSSSKSFQVPEVGARNFRLKACAYAQVVDVGLALCPGPYGGVSVSVVVAVGVGIGITVTIGITVGIVVLAVLLGVAIPMSSSPSTAPKAPMRSVVPRSLPSSPHGPPLGSPRYSSASMEVRSTGTELPPLRCLGRGG